MHSRFFKKSRSIFGSRLLQMNSNTIKSLCNSNKFHFSQKIQNLKINKIESKNFLSCENINLSENTLESLLTEDKETLEILKNLNEIMNFTVMNNVCNTVCMISTMKQSTALN